MENKLYTLDNKIQKVSVFNGQLVSWFIDKKELMHGGGKPDFKGDGWKNSDIEMFPVIDTPTGFSVFFQNPNSEIKQYNMDSHGILRWESPSFTQVNGNDQVTIGKNWFSDSEVQNGKSGGGRPKILNWPYSFTMTKQINLSENDTLNITHTISRNNVSNSNDSETMPYMFGYHPAFNVIGENLEKKKIIIKGNTINIKQLQEMVKTNNGGGICFEKSGSVDYIDEEEEYTLEFTFSQNYKYVMIWSSSPNMFCIEPLTRRPLKKNERPFVSQTEGDFLTLEKNSYVSFEFSVLYYKHIKQNL